MLFTFCSASNTLEDVDFVPFTELIKKSVKKEQELSTKIQDLIPRSDSFSMCEKSSNLISEHRKKKIPKFFFKLLFQIKNNLLTHHNHNHDEEHFIFKSLPILRYLHLANGF